MKITYNPNPLYTKIILDHAEQKELWHKLKYEELEELLYGAHFALKDGKYFNLESARDYVDPDYYISETDDSKSQLDQYIDKCLQYHLEALQSAHVGDCTCVACSCMKCHVEQLLGIDTIKGLGKHVAHKIESAFGTKNDKTLDEALEYLKNYDPQPSNPEDTSWLKVGGFAQYVPRWKNEAAVAYEWLLKYKNTHFSTTHYAWAEKKPPINTWVWASYDINKQDWQLLKTCKQGCCVKSSFGSMLLPNYWYLATDEEGLAEQEQWNKIPKINLADLYE